MPLSGQSVSQQISRAVQDAQDELNRTRTAAAQIKQAISEISEDREHTLANLAQHYLPDLSRDSLLQMWTEARVAIEQILNRKESHISKAEQELERLNSQRQLAETQLETDSATLDQLLVNQQQVSQQLSEVLAANQEFINLTQRAAEAEAALERAEASLEEIEHDANQKLPAYEKSKLFTYLYRRGMGTAEYQSRGLTRRMDRWISRLIDYPKARIGYEYLKSTPAQVRNLVAQDREAFAVVMAELERQRDEEAEKIGLNRIVANVRAADEARRQTLDQLDHIRTQTDAARTELANVEHAQGPYYQEAITYLKSLLQRSEQETLEARAQRTPDPRDDHIVAELRQLDHRVRDIKTDAAARQQRLDWLDRHLSELGQLQQRFRMARYDSAQSEFDTSVDVYHDLAAVREGRDTIENVWNRLRSRHRVAVSTIGAAGSGLAEVVAHPLTQVLVQAMASAATQSMSGHAQRAGQRHSQSYSRSSSSKPTNISFGSVRSHQPSPPASRSGGFYTSEKI